VRRRSSRPPLASRLALGLAALPISSALAQTAVAPRQAPTPPGDPALDSEALVQQGVAYRRAGQDQLALERFRAAHQRAPSPRILAQIALAEQALGQWAHADRDLREALSASGDPWIQRNRAALEAALNTILSRLATIEVLCATPGAQLFINGRDAGALPLREPIRVESGTVTLEVRRDGFRPVRRTIDVESGRAFRESFTLVEQPAAVEEQPLARTPRERLATAASPPVEAVSPASAPLIVLGAALLGGGASAHVYWQDRVRLYNSDVILRADGGFEPGCFLSTETYPRRSDRCASVLTESWAGFGLTVAGYTLGAASIGAGVILRWIRRPESPPARASRWACVPSLAEGGARCLVQF
jgi:tetratricopeptide (TPR) repeat protein